MMRSPGQIRFTNIAGETDARQRLSNKTVESVFQDSYTVGIDVPQSVVGPAVDGAGIVVGERPVFLIHIVEAIRHRCRQMP